MNTIMKIKRGLILLFLLMTVCSLYNTTNAQTYSLQSLEGAKVRVNLLYKPSLGTLAISYLKDTLLLVDYMDINNVKVLNNRFLQITYAKRAGSNEDLENMLLLCVDNKKLCQAMHIRSGSTYDMRNIQHIKGNLSEYQLFKVKVRLFGNGKNNYKLNLSIHDESTSERTPKTNHNYNKQVILSFDPNQDIFYSTRQSISKTFTVYDPKIQQTIKQDVNGVVPVITLDKSNYYYVKGEWYEQGIKDYLLKYAYK
ncbi:MAG: hypothetical protein P0Y49_21190 [Candidatus Pedobacter colombiensis]|uniref:Uncharacterized protein n=1 Tax=Candidatus Pedobacter colombiensis TaxID=3121371 RepID=A0AAJ6B6W9_9SPHI|nr:hypothetical protein [Pedobacter sp.]WEK19294.1 MAG: hypothetical protein P0Y49_21190 [Pedobacter sp.]